MDATNSVVSIDLLEVPLVLEEFPLSLVKSRTWLTVSISEFPHAWTVSRYDDC